MITPTERQREIRDAREESLLIVAPAGCGKTEALALRVAGLLQREQVRAPKKILVATFSNRARDNINERLSHYVPLGALRERLVVSNFHGLSARVYRAHANVIGLPSDLALPQADWIGAQCKTLGLSFRQAGSVQTLLRRAKQELRNDEQVLQYLLDKGDPIAVALERKRREEGRLTYDDLPRLAEVILQVPEVSRLYRQHFGAVVVDECQDLTPQQFRLLEALGRGKTTFAGDLAQGIYGFAGARPDWVFDSIRAVAERIVVFTESHRSSPAVLAMVNALGSRTGCEPLSCATPEAWPHGGLAGQVVFTDVNQEAERLVAFARFILTRSPNHRVAFLTRTAGRRAALDAAFEKAEGLPSFVWTSPLLDAESRRVVETVLKEARGVDVTTEDDVPTALMDLADVSAVTDTEVLGNIRAALTWVGEQLSEGRSLSEIAAEVALDGHEALSTASGVHLLTGHVGKGQQFDWVCVVGAEEGCLPDFRADTAEALREEARIFSVMVSRARHGVLVSHSQRVPTATGNVRAKEPSRFLADFEAVPQRLAGAEVSRWLEEADWRALSSR